MEGSELNGTMTKNPTNFIDSSDAKGETVEVGVIVMGLCCICLVACALVVLQLRSNSRRIPGNRQRAGHSGGVSDDRSRDPLDVGAPPSYDAVIRSPHLYPPSRQTFSTPDVSETRRSSGSSTFSLSLHSPRLTHHSHVAPRGTSEENLSQHSDIRSSHEEDIDEPPPPYPGNIVLTPIAQSANSAHYICHVNSRPSRWSTTRTCGNHVENEPCRRDSGVGESRNHVVNAWTNRETSNQLSHGEASNDLCRTNRCQSNPERRSLDVNNRETNRSLTVVSHSSQLQGAKVAVFVSQTLPSEYDELTSTV